MTAHATAASAKAPFAGPKKWGKVLKWALIIMAALFVAYLIWWIAASLFGGDTKSSDASVQPATSTASTSTSSATPSIPQPAHCVPAGYDTGMCPMPLSGAYVAPERDAKSGTRFCFSPGPSGFRKIQYVSDSHAGLQDFDPDNPPSDLEAYVFFPKHEGDMLVYYLIDGPKCRDSD